MFACNHDQLILIVFINEENACLCAGEIVVCDGEGM